MNFEINGRTWKILEISQNKIRQHFIEYKYDGEPGNGKYYGMTYFDEQTIYIDKDMHIEQKKQTLMHELMHCYIGVFLFNNSRDYTEEDLCNISANSHDIIHKIVEQMY